MKEYIEERAVEAARYIIEQKATVRQAPRKWESARVPYIKM